MVGVSVAVGVAVGDGWAGRGALPWADATRPGMPVVAVLPVQPANQAAMSSATSTVRPTLKFMYQFKPQI